MTRSGSEHAPTDAASDDDAGREGPNADRRTAPLPETLRSPRTKLVYLYLRTAGGARVEELKQSLGMRVLALYPVLETLVEDGLVDRDGARYVVTAADGD